MAGQKRVEDARERAYDPAIHRIREKPFFDGPPEIGFTRFRTFQVCKSDKSDLHGQARG
jgi:hypothetical protein